MPEVEEYTIGWICALSKELIAAKAFLDVRHDPFDNAAINDDNNYTLGSIGKHNVVIAVLPYGQYGLVNAAAALKDMTRTFSNLRAVLMVGIGGGVPGKTDIRLGDIVVGSVGRDSSGVIQYDYGRAVQGQEFAVTGHLNQPPMAFLTAMSALHATYEMEGHSIEANVNEALENYKRLRKKYKRPDASTDRLYRADIVHEGGEGLTCSETCGNKHLVHRKEREDVENGPSIHYGLIASGNSLIKDALLRDKLAAKHGILCFEMEAAGLMNHFPCCVVIRGICDYSDSHKNDEWQGYAAMVAVAYAKDLLLQVAPSSLQKEQRVQTLLRQLNEQAEDIRHIATDSSRDIKLLSSSIRDDAISKWLNPADPSVDHNKAREACHADTGRWLLDSPQYVTWKSQKNSFVWLNGNSGTGKTILMSTVIDDIRNSCLPQLCSCAVLYFYITFTDRKKQSLEAIICSLINQLYHHQPESRHHITSLHSKHNGGSSQASIDQLKATFHDMLSVAGETFILLDALDEYKDRSTQRAELLAWIESFGDERINTHLLVTSRPEHDIKTSLEAWANPESIISLETDSVGRDISEYVRDAVTNSTGFRRWHGHTSTLDTIVNTLTAKSNGVFRWVALQLERLKECINAEEVKVTLQTLPTTLQATYYRVINNLTSTRKKYVIRILQLLAYSDIPMTLEAVVDALAVDLTAPPGSRLIIEERMPLPAEISSLCSTLFRAVSTKHYYPILGQWRYETTMQLAHSSVKEFILSCPRNEFEGLLTESTAGLTIAQICLVYFLEMDYSLAWENLLSTYHLLPFATKTWLDGARCRGPRFNTFSHFSHLSIELFLNRALFKRWRELIAENTNHRLSFTTYKLPEQDQLFYASWSGDEDCVKKLLEANATRDTTAWRIDHALLIASESGYLGITALLVREGANVNVQGEKLNALCTAAKFGHTNIVALLIKEGANDDAEESILDIATKHGHLDIIDLLIREGGESGIGDALYSASDYGRLDIVMQLMEKGADVNAQTQYGTALQAACNSGQLHIIMFLLEKGAYIDAHMGGPYNALQFASIEGHLGIVDCLLEKGADVNGRGEEYNVSLCPTPEPDGFYTFPYHAYHFGRPLHLASYYGHSDIVRYLVERGADVNAQGGYFGTAICAASCSGHINIAAYLIEKGADINAQGGYYGTALCTASYFGHLHIVARLVEQGADRNAPGGRYCNALEAALTSQQFAIAKFLRCHKANFR